MKFIFWSLIFGLSSQHASAAATTVRASLDTNKITVEDEATLTLTISGEYSVDDISVPRVNGLDIVHTGRSSSIQIINGHKSIEAIYIYQIVASAEGEYTIPPFEVRTDDGTLKSNSVTLSVSQTSYAVPPKQYEPIPQQPADAEDLKSFWIETRVDKKEVFVGEQVLFHFRLYTVENIQSAEFELPSFDNFFSEVVVKDKQGTKEVQGINYAVLDRVIALFPLKPGKVLLDETRFKFQYKEIKGRSRGQWDPFSNSPFFSRDYVTKTKVLRSSPIEIEVKSLPEPIPEDFTRLVGNFGVQASLSDTEVDMGDPVTLEIVFSGAGNIRDAVLPKISVDGAKVYVDKPNLDTVSSYEGISGKKIFKVALVPTRAGELNLPTWPLSYFDPTKGEYVRFETRPLNVSVLPGKQESTHSTLTQKPTDELADQNGNSQTLAPLIADAAEVFGSSPLLLHPRLVAVFYFAPPLLFFFLLINRRLKFEGLSKARGIKLAGKNLRTLLEKDGCDQSEILSAVRRYFSAKFAIDGTALTAHEMEALLCSKGFSGEFARRLRTLIEDLEARQYGFHRDEPLTAVKKELKTVIEQL